MILNQSQSQAEAVYSAMCALNNVNGKIKVSFGWLHTNFINVWETDNEVIHVVKGNHFVQEEGELYYSQDDFYKAYIND